LAIGALAWWVILLVVVTIIFPMANFIFLWLLLFALFGVADLFLFEHQKHLTWIGVIILSVAALPGLLLLPPAIYSVVLGLIALVSLTGAGLVLVSLLIGLLVPHLEAMTWSETGFGQWWLSAGSAMLGGVVLVIAIITIKVDTEHPRFVHLIYGLDDQSGEAIWASFLSSDIHHSEFSHEWSEQFFSEKATQGPLPIFYGTDRRQFKFDQAPVVPVPHPDVTVLESTREGDILKLHLLITSAREATQASFYIAPPAEVLSLAINGETLAVANNPPDREEMWTLNFYGPLAAGIELSLEVKSPQAVEMRLVERAAGLPDIPGIASQPDYMIPYSDTDVPGHVTYISSFFTFD